MSRNRIRGVFVLLIGLGVIAYFILQSTADQSGEEQPGESEDEIKPDEENEGDEKVNTELTFALNAEDDKMFYTVENEGDGVVTLKFATSQKYEYEISDETGVISKYSEGRAFLQAVEEIDLAAGDEQSFEVELPKLEPGKYTIKIYLTASDLAETSEISEKFEVTSDNSLNIN